MTEIPNRNSYAEFYYDLDETTSYSVDVLTVKCFSFNRDLFPGKFPYHRLAWQWYGRHDDAAINWWLIAEANDVVNPFEKQPREKEYLIPVPSKTEYMDY